MFNYKEVGLIYKNAEGKYLVRIVNRGYFDRTHYTLKFVDDIQYAMLFADVIDVDGSEIQYRTLFAKDLIESCEVVKVEVHTQYLRPREFKVLEG